MLKIRLEKDERARRIVGWVAVGITVVFTNLWTYWGIIENFHEGWYSISLLENLGMLFLQYLLFTIAFVALALVSIRWPKAGLGLHIALGAFFGYFFNSAHFNVMGLLIVLPILGLGFLYFYGRPQPKKWANRIIVILPLIIILAVTPYKLIQVSRRVDDGDYGMRTVEGNGVTLSWAPRGPGWPEGGDLLRQSGGTVPVSIRRRHDADGRAPGHLAAAHGGGGGALHDAAR